MDLNKFISDISQKGIAKAHLAQVLITRTKGGDSSLEADMTMRIESTDFPGRSLTTTDSNYTGVAYKIVTGATFAEIPISIILSENFREKEYLEKWQDAAVGSYRKQEIQSNSFSLGYYKDYIGTVDIVQYNELDKAVYKAKLIDAFPTGIGVVNSSWEQGDQILKLPVTFTYRYYKIEDIKN